MLSFLCMSLAVSLLQKTVYGSELIIPSHGYGSNSDNMVASYDSSDDGSSNRNYTRCINKQSCKNRIIGTEYCECFGYYACYHSIINSKYTMSLGTNGAYRATISSDVVRGHGLYSLRKATVYTTLVHAFGFLGAYNSHLESSPNSETLSVYLYGYYSGYYSDVLCHSGDTCNVYCGASFGCKKLKMFCYKGSTCEWDCSDDPHNCPSVFFSDPEEKDNDSKNGKRAGQSSDADADNDNDEELSTDDIDEERDDINDDDSPNAYVMYGLTDDEIDAYYESWQTEKENEMNSNENQLFLKQTLGQYGSDIVSANEVSLAHATAYMEKKHNNNKNNKNDNENGDIGMCNNIVAAVLEYIWTQFGLIFMVSLLIGGLLHSYVLKLQNINGGSTNKTDHIKRQYMAIPTTTAV